MSSYYLLNLLYYLSDICKYFTFISIRKEAIDKIQIEPKSIIDALLSDKNSVFKKNKPKACLCFAPPRGSHNEGTVIYKFNLPWETDGNFVVLRTFSKN